LFAPRRAQRLTSAIIVTVFERQFVMAVAIPGIAACTTSGEELLVADATDGSSAISGNPTEAEAAIVQAGEPEESVEATVADPHEMICMKERVTGSHISKTVCMTRAERDRIRDVSQGNWEAERRKTGANSPTQ